MEGEKSVGLELRKVSNMIKKKLDLNTGVNVRKSLTGTHMWIISYLLDHSDEDVFQRDLESKFNIGRSTATSILQLMEKNGLIVRAAVAYDARLKKLIPTPAAIELDKKIKTEIAAMEEQIMHNISDEELAALLATLDKIKNNLE